MNLNEGVWKNAAGGTASLEHPGLTREKDAAVAAAVTCSSTCGQTSSKKTDPDVDVIIVGAGWAGLAAMNALHCAGIHHVLALEARDYIGGRSRTLRDFVPGLPVEMGSEWVYADTPIQTKSNELGLQFGVTNNGFDALGLYEKSAVLQTNRPQLSQDEKKDLLETIWVGERGFVAFVEDKVEELTARGQDLDWEQVIHDFIENNKINSEKERQFLKTMVFSEVASDYAAPLGELSLKETAKIFDEGNIEMHYLAVPGGGYDLLIDALAEPFRDRIQLNSRVSTIRYGLPGELAQVTFVDKSGTTKTITACAVLITVPLGVLKASDIEFVPPLPKAKLHAIHALGFGNLNKCILYWQDADQVDAWWPKDQVWLGLMTNDEESFGSWTYFFNAMSQGNGGHPILVGYIVGDQADAMEHETDEQVLKDVLCNLRTMLGDKAVPKPTKYKVTRWGQDEFSRGAYSFPYSGNKSRKFRKALRHPVGNLFWAGEATEDEWSSTTVGAYNSGVRAGKKIAGCLRDIEADIIE